MCVSTYAGILWERIPRMVVASSGAVILLVFGSLFPSYSSHQAVEGIDFDTMSLLPGIGLTPKTGPSMRLVLGETSGKRLAGGRYAISPTGHLLVQFPNVKPIDTPDALLCDRLNRLTIQELEKHLQSPPSIPVTPKGLRSFSQAHPELKNRRTVRGISVSTYPSGASPSSTISVTTRRL